MKHGLVLAADQSCRCFDEAAFVALFAAADSRPVFGFHLLSVFVLPGCPLGVQFPGVSAVPAPGRCWVVDVRLALAGGFSRVY